MSSSADQQTAALLARVGSRIRAARNAAGMTQADLAAKIGCVRSSVANIEQGRQGLTLMRLGQLAAALGMSLDALIVPAKFPAAPAPQAHKASVIRAWVAGCTTCGTAPPAKTWRPRRKKPEARHPPRRRPRSAGWRQRLSAAASWTSSRSRAPNGSA
jgi:transcriptional regulator with XRE-family HTH domain